MRHFHYQVSLFLNFGIPALTLIPQEPCYENEDVFLDPRGASWTHPHSTPRGCLRVYDAMQCTLPSTKPYNKTRTCSRIRAVLAEHLRIPRSTDTYVQQERERVLGSAQRWSNVCTFYAPQMLTTRGRTCSRIPATEGGTHTARHAGSLSLLVVHTFKKRSRDLNGNEDLTLCPNGFRLTLASAPSSAGAAASRTGDDLIVIDSTMSEGKIAGYSRGLQRARLSSAMAKSEFADVKEPGVYIDWHKVSPLARPVRAYIRAWDRGDPVAFDLTAMTQSTSRFRHYLCTSPNWELKGRGPGAGTGITSAGGSHSHLFCFVKEVITAAELHCVISRISSSNTWGPYEEPTKGWRRCTAGVPRHAID
ncbi:hypothetical protein Hypma_004159 [Hypsizygus marmoreus]|uniref:Uncharacterized protein n=1 Tax=Hypsizygus marmoreus TaxID=39966 RepID=A0A369J0C5_HYPMA|nr:hypothetical protein Hypma_004159 [Hypsizygus marmoreus]